MNGLKHRISRHLIKVKKLHWHIDYLLNKAKIIKVVTYKTNKKVECQLNKNIQSLPGAKIIVKKFGSSDCKCTSHLTYFGESNPSILLNKNLLK